MESISQRSGKEDEATGLVMTRTRWRPGQRVGVDWVVMAAHAEAKQEP